MGLVTGITYKNNGDEIQSTDWGDPVAKIIAQINGNLDDTNIASVSGSKIAAGSLPASAFDNTATSGWNAISTPLTYGTNNGNKEFTVTAAADLTNVLSPGMRFKVNRAVVPPTQCMSFTAGSSQYATKTSPVGMTSTDDITVEAWVRIKKYANNGIISYGSNASGFRLFVNPDGTVDITGFNGTANYRQVKTTVALPLGEWVHVAASFDMSSWTTTNNKIYFNGDSRDVTLVTNGTSPTSMALGGNLYLGDFYDGTAHYTMDGEISEVRVWSGVRSASQIRDNMCTSLVGNELNLLALFQGNGNFNDKTSNANNLTAVNSASSTFPNNPYKATEYAIVTDVTYSAPNTTVTLFCGTDHTIPSTVLSAPCYSPHAAPFGFPAAKHKWRTTYVVQSLVSANISTINTFTQLPLTLNFPIGSFDVGYRILGQFESTAGGTRSGFVTLTNGTPSIASGVVSNAPAASRMLLFGAAVDQKTLVAEEPFTITSATRIFRLYGAIDTATGTENWGIRGSQQRSIIYAQCAWA